ncbi:MAG TPA: DUF6351 family protein [Acidimicrobiales bacterium]
MGHLRPHLRPLALAAAVAVLAAACSGDDGGSAGGDGTGDGDEGGLAVEVVSSRPQDVTGGDALVAVRLPEGTPAEQADDLTVTAGDRDVSEAFGRDPRDDDRLVGLVDGLEEGDETEITARLGDDDAAVTVTDHPTTGPIFSGEQLPLYACSTEVFGLDPATPEEGCAAPAEVTWEYVDADGQRHDLADPARPPADADTVEVDGERVPFVLRTETGVLDRAVYRITLLEPHPDPGGEPDTSAWNGRLVYRFGGGCGASFTQGYFLLGPASTELLADGYAMATATFNTYQVLCNDVISAETASMVKEHVAETYGEPVHTIGEGGSGGAIQQILLAQNHPGLLDGIAPLLPFPDALSISPGVYDCVLLTRYFASPQGAGLTPAQRRAVTGFATPETCAMWADLFGPTTDALHGCDTDFSAAFAGGADATVPTIPPAERYDPDTNPDGYRCTVWESNVAITGRDPDTGHARSGYDNEGVLYGLDALDAGDIDAEQFVTLNERVGGLDADGQPQRDRSVVADDLAARAYETGRVSGPWGGLPETPMILVNPYTDPQGDIHDRVRAFSILDRMAGDGDEPPATVSLWTLPLPADASVVDTLSGALGDRLTAPIVALDEWLTAADEAPATGDEDRADVLARTKPASAESRCVLPGGDELVGPDANTDPACEEAYPVSEDPRMAAGGPRSGATLKCALMPLDEAADQFEVDLSRSQLDRLAAVFPSGVCDWSRPGEGYGPPTATWPDLGAG